ncbi:MAG: DNA alkylation repair protein [Pirellulales bacterium]|nr:DNA alkylation repair protein [Pirellulales bacterium]
MSSFSLKDQLFNRDRVLFLANLFHAADSVFDPQAFVREVMKQLPKLELKQRIVWIAEVLQRYLPQEFPEAAAKIAAALPPPLDEHLTDDDFGDFIFAPLGEFVARNGMAKKHLRLSLRTLKEITKRFSMEDAIRHFIRKFPDPTLTELTKWSKDRNYHVRRLVSEGTRPSLPWSGRIGLDVTATIDLLDNLHCDNTRFVTRSVANHLNDIAKTNPQLVLATLSRWQDLGRQDPDELNWMTRHALRTLIKQGNPEALKLLGFRPNPKINVSEITLQQDTVRPGEALEFSVTLTAGREEALLVDYVIDFVKSNGKTAPKVFKATKLKLKKNESKTVTKRHPLRADATTFTLYPGTHRLSIQINGSVFTSRSFELQSAK